MMVSKARLDRALGPIVSSAHLASGTMPALSELEFGMILLDHAFERWTVCCMAAAGGGNLSPLDVLVLHTIANRTCGRSAADICLVLNIQNTYLVTYSLKKLGAHKLLTFGRGGGKKKTVILTLKGKQVAQRYSKVREALLVKPVISAGFDVQRLSEIAVLMGTLFEHFDEAARAAGG